MICYENENAIVRENCRYGVFPGCRIFGLIEHKMTGMDSALFQDAEPQARNSFLVCFNGTMYLLRLLECHD